MGTVAYLAPEQVERGAADPRSDVYSAGILLYEMLTGVPPFSGETPMAVAYQHVNSDVPAPSSLVQGLPAELDQLVLVATARDAARRPPDASEMLRLLREARSRIDLDRTAVASEATDTVDLTKTLVVPAGAVADGGGGQSGSAYAPPAGRSPGRGGPVAYVPADDHPSISTIGGGDRLPSAARTGPRSRRTWIGLVILLLVALAAGIGAWYVGAGRYTSTPSVIGMAGTAARHKLTTDGFTMTLANAQYSETVPTGYVISTDPGPGQRIEKHGSVAVVLSRGKLRYKVPNLANMSVSDATNALTATHLVVGSTTQAYSSTIAAGKVVSTSPSAAAEVKSGSAVNLVVSKGLPPVAAPNLVGSSMSSAQSAALSLNLTVVSSGQQSSMTVPKGDIISQAPAPGTQVAQKSQITVVVSSGPPLVLVPDVVGMSTQDARKALQKAGFKVHTYNELPAVLLNTVYTENPGGGSKAPLGSTVNLGIV
jgi:eukaryotic-like serine/threonine-protein kinase